MQVAVFGGSFDPPHIGHKKIVLKALNHLSISKIFVVPTYLNPFKTSYKIDALRRLSLVETMFKENHKVEVLDYEVQQNRAVSTIETINFIIQRYNPSKIFIIIGADNLESLEKWNNYKELLQKAEFVIVTRDNISIASKFKRLLVKMPISSSMLRRKLDMDFIPKEIEKNIKEYYEQ